MSRRPLVQRSSREIALKPLLISLAALGLAAVAGAACAQDADSINVKSKVTARCSALSAPSSSLTLGGLATSDAHVVSAFTGTTSYSFSTYWCNSPVTLTLAATPLTNTDVPTLTAEQTAGFTNRVDYKATLTWDDVHGEKSTASAGDVTVNTTEANTGELKLAVSNPDGGTKRVIAGAYAGSITLTVALP